MDKDLKAAEKAKYEAGAGMWFHNETNEQVLVKAQLYPRVSLTLHDATGQRKISKAELDSDYHRLRI